ncbi:MAG: aminotransferase class I/II-fold pyridoxal phosphate-dependent enzyme [Lachnospiraceae bacterium]|nr:aminotransferase class I/II-fold pyridoxal phosphate-dependent enzyme [Lachnospiraceae bacterium]
MKKRIYLASPTMHGDEQRFVKEAFDTNWIAPLGPNVNCFEEELAEYVHMNYAAALSSGTAGIHLALKMLGVETDDIVFCSDLTFAATVNPVSYVGARQIFIDSDKESWNMDVDALEKAFQTYGRPKAVIVANLYGTPAKLDIIRDICQKYETPLIEDAAESLGASYKGKMTGSFGDIGIFSFNGNKIITTSGGGMLVSDKEEYVKKARFLATQAREPERHYEHKEIGYNYRMSNVLAGIGRGQLLHIEEHIEKKREIYMQYTEAFQEIDAIEMNPIPLEAKANYWLSCMTIKQNSPVRPLDIILALEKENIESRPIWKPMHLQPIYAGCEFVSVQRSSVGEDIFNRGLCLPSDIKNQAEDMDKIIEIVKNCFE